MTNPFSDLKQSVLSMRFATLAIAAMWLVLWHARAAQQFSLEATVYVVAFVAICAAYGSLFERATSGFFPNKIGVTYRLLTGFFTFNSLLFILTIATPLGIVMCVAILAIVPFAIIASLSRHGPSNRPDTNEWPGLTCVALAGLVATLWAAEHQPVMEIRNGAAVFRSWFDIFIHVREISAFVQGHGLSSMSDIKMLGSPAPAYHFASYVGAAAFSAPDVLERHGQLRWFSAAVRHPAARARRLRPRRQPCSGPGLDWSHPLPWSRFPDAYEQGFGEGYLGFQFMSQVNLGMLYGIACMSLAWTFMIEGCRRARYATVIVGYGFLALTLMYKAHVFVAGAYVLLIFPCLYFAGLRWRWRLAALLAMTVIFVAVIEVSQLSPNVPTLRLDGSGGGEYMSILYLGFDNGPLKHVLRWLLFDHRLGRVADAATATVLILLGSFGIWIVAAPAIFWASRRRLPASIPGLVALVFVNYWVMSIGLAVDERRHRRSGRTAQPSDGMGLFHHRRIRFRCALSTCGR